MRLDIEPVMQKEPGKKISRSKWSISNNSFILSGVISPILYVMVFTIDGLLHPGYSPVHQTISSLSAGPYGWIQNTNAIVCGVLLIVFAFAFFRMMHLLIRKKWLMMSFILLTLAGAGLTVSGFFPGSASTNQADIHVAIHNYCFLAIFYSLMIVCFIVGRQLLKILVWRNYGWYSIITGLVTLVGYGVIVYAAHFMPTMVGILERFMFIEAFAWYVVIGCRCLALQRT